MNSPRAAEAAAFEPRFVLQRELARRCSTNPRYSLRAFARALGVSHTVLSLVMSGKRPLSRKASFRIAPQIELTPEERLLFVSHLGEAEMHAPVQTLKSTEPQSYHQISLDTFAVLSDWYHYALLSLVDLPSFKPQPRWISRRLGITEVEARIAFERLERLGLIAQVRGRWRQATASLKVDNLQSSQAARSFHRQLLQKALYSLENDSRDKRNFTCVVLPMNASQVAYAKERMISFQRDLMKELEGKARPDSVYSLCLQFFPLTTSSLTEETP